MESFRVVGANRVVWLNLTGSGNETSTHIQENSRMTIMFAAFEGKPLIVRLYRHATVIHRNDVEWKELYSLFTAVLKHYAQSVTQKSIDILNAGGSRTENIYRWLHCLCRSSGDHRNGCLLTNTAVEIVPHDVVVAKQVRKEFRRVEIALKNALNRAIAYDELEKVLDTASLATLPIWNCPKTNNHGPPRFKSGKAQLACQYCVVNPLDAHKKQVITVSSFNQTNLSERILQCLV